MALPGVAALRAERVAFVATIDSLSDDEFESGGTLCDRWAPRDVLAHLMGVDLDPFRYIAAKGDVDRANEQMVEQARGQSRARITHRARHWAARTPPPLTQLIAPFVLGDVAVHHQDVLRGLGRTRDVPPEARAAIFRTGLVLGFSRWRRHRAEPTDGGFPFGFGLPVHGTREALGLWLAGRRGIEAELDFEGFLNVAAAPPASEPPAVTAPLDELWDVDEPLVIATPEPPAVG